MAGGDFTALILMLLLGFGAFILGGAWLAWSVLAGAFRTLISLMRGRPAAAVRQGAGMKIRTRDVKFCPRPQCRKVERRPARFCSQCGARLGAVEDV